MPMRFESFAQRTQPPRDAISNELSTQVLMGGSAVLNLATGAGELGVAMAKRFPNVQFVLSDESPQMMKEATNLAEGLTNVSLVSAELENLQEFDKESMDSVICSNGLEHTPNVNQALLEIHRVLKPSGIFIATRWTQLPLVDFTNNAMTTILGGAAPPPPVNPLSLQTDGLVNKLLLDANLTALKEEQDAHSFHLSLDPKHAFAVAMFNVLPLLKQLGDSDREVAHQMFDEEAKSQNYLDSNGDYVVPGNAHKLVVAKKQEQDDSQC